MTICSRESSETRTKHDNVKKIEDSISLMSGTSFDRLIGASISLNKFRTPVKQEKQKHENVGKIVATT